MDRVFHDTDIDYRIKALLQKTKGAEGPQGLIVPEAELRSAIDDVYEAFSGRTLSAPFAFCDCCITTAMASHWQTSSLRSLDADDLWAVMSNIPSVAGTTDDLLYFAPRVLEYAALEGSVLDLSWTFSSLQRLEHTRVTPREVNALRQFFEPIWKAQRAGETPHAQPLRIDHVLLATTVLTDEIERYLEIIRDSPALQMVRKGLNDAFWYPNGAHLKSVVVWLRAAEA